MADANIDDSSCPYSMILCLKASFAKGNPESCRSTFKMETFPFQLEAPLFITWFQCLVSIAVIFLLSLLEENYPAIDKFPAFKIEIEVAKQVYLLATLCLRLSCVT